MYIKKQDEQVLSGNFGAFLTNKQKKLKKIKQDMRAKKDVTKDISSVKKSIKKVVDPNKSVYPVRKKCEELFSAPNNKYQNKQVKLMDDLVGLMKYKRKSLQMRRKEEKLKNFIESNGIIDLRKKKI